MSMNSIDPTVKIINPNDTATDYIDDLPLYSDTYTTTFTNIVKYPPTSSFYITHQIELAKIVIKPKVCI